eukprot:4779293-Alexandrium_andersonii.AAC.1
MRCGCGLRPAPARAIRPSSAFAGGRSCQSAPRLAGCAPPQWHPGLPQAGGVGERRCHGCARGQGGLRAW